MQTYHCTNLDRPARWQRVTLDNHRGSIETAIDAHQSLYIACSREEAEQRLLLLKQHRYQVQEKQEPGAPLFPVPPVPTPPIPVAPTPTVTLEQAYRDWAGGLAYITNGQYRLRQQIVNGVTVINHIAPWNALVKAAYSDSLDFHLYATAKHPKPKKTARRQE